MITVTWHGHSCYTIDIDGTKIVLDPFFTGSPVAQMGADEVEADFILLSHGHSDHLGDAIAIAARTGATIVAPFELASWCGEQGATVHPMHIGGGFDFPWGRLQLTIAHHGSALIEDGGRPLYLGNPCGFLLKTEMNCVYYAGDTGLFLDMKLIGDRNRIDLALLPIGDNFTMGIEDAITATQYLKPKTAIPMHYGTWEVIDTDPEEFAAGVDKVGVNCVVLQVGESYVIE